MNRKRAWPGHSTGQTEMTTSEKGKRKYGESCGGHFLCLDQALTVLTGLLGCMHFVAALHTVTKESHSPGDSLTPPTARQFGEICLGR